ncbi:hypothetical protein BABINDRAFT_162670 [Babjeviella inositovora NRRL Y-12698]|uniref:Major facilitator superfamily (MFS) profile domain-containing protein n=1 Tax=Babjeviella inositovora NRRL Y-12698 TaxID=984486 RepID=A0A1E3QN79_9ASCO|nr:uncharacterized protein BABINDRAFT_162670 [Babjeviella inositovora NRRL Y-12698]ODQ78447.1 hypothetical protein BABINDRAFT_162670 [Babjeviella inositovora NRRL Y-12698]
MSLSHPETHSLAQPLLTALPPLELYPLLSHIGETSPPSIYTPTIENTITGTFAYLVVLSAAIGGLLFGYDTGVISGVLVTVGTDLGETLTPHQMELITAITSIGALVGSCGAGFWADRVGRKRIIAVCCVVFIAAACGMGFSQTVTQLVCGRLVVGFAVGAASMIVPVYIAEIAPSHQRGMLLTLNSVATTGGQAVAYIVAVLVKDWKYSWRIMILVSVVPPAIFLLVVGFIPESPRFLVLKNDVRTASSALGKLYPSATAEQIGEAIEIIQKDVLANKAILQETAAVRLFGKTSTVRALAVCCGLMMFQQLCGFNALMYYSPTIFQTLGIKNPLLTGLFIALTNFAFTFVAVYLIDRVGRRKILLNTVWIMSLTLFGAGYFLRNMKPGAEPSTGNSQIIMALCCLCLYVASYASALGTVPWTASELLPMEARALGATLVTCCNWLTNTIVSVSFLSLVTRIGSWGTFSIYGAVCVLGWLGIYVAYPEVNGLPLEVVSKIFEDGFGVGLANEMRREFKYVGERREGGVD